MDPRAKEVIRLIFGSVGCTAVAGICFGLGLDAIGFIWTVCAIAAFLAADQEVTRP